MPVSLVRPTGLAGRPVLCHVDGPRMVWLNGYVTGNKVQGLFAAVECIKLEAEFCQ